jgi:hypothetical protein
VSGAKKRWTDLEFAEELLRRMNTIEIDGATVTTESDDFDPPEFYSQAKERVVLTIRHRGKRVLVELRAPSAEALERYRAGRPWRRAFKANVIHGKPVPTHLVMAVDESGDNRTYRWWAAGAEVNSEMPTMPTMPTTV